MLTRRGFLQTTGTASAAALAMFRDDGVAHLEAASRYAARSGVFGSESSLSRELANHELHFVSSLEAVDGDAEIVSTFIYSRIDGPFLDRHPAMKLIATRSTTHDHLELESCAKRNVTMCIVPSYGDHVVAEHTFALSSRSRDDYESR